MPDDGPLVGRTLRRRFPMVRIFESAGLALSPASILIATAASLLLSMATGLFDRLLVSSPPETKADVIATTGLPIAGIVSTESTSIRLSLLRPWLSVVRPAVLGIATDGGIMARLSGLVQFLTAFTIWSLVGLILCRRSACLFAGNDEYTVRQAVEFGVKRWLTCAMAPAIPVAAIGMVGFVIAIIGLVGRFPFAGSVWLLVLSPVIAFLSVVIAVPLLATIVGWPVMTAAVATDDCDGFGGLSRAFSGLAGRPWQFLAYSGLAIVAGMILLTIIDWVGELAVNCALSFTALGGGAAARDTLLGPVSRIVRELELGIGVSFFWAAATVIYLFLRLDLDGVPLHRIIDENAAAERDPFPVVGIPATDSRGESPRVSE